MTRSLLALLAAMFLALAAVQPAAAKRVALVIGNDAYDNLPALAKAVNDARTMTATLAAIGFDVTSGENLTRRQTNRLLADFEAGIGPGDEAFFFFAGHGVAIDGENYLLPRDMPLPRSGEEGLVKDEGHAVGALVERIRRAGAETTFMVLDACRDNPFAATGTRSIGTSRGLSLVESPRGVFLLYSAGYGQAALDRLSDDDPNPNSVFTRKLAPLLATPGLTHVEIAKEVQQEVSALAATVHHDQQPAYYDQIVGTVVLVPGERPAAAASPRLGAAEAWAAVQATESTAILNAFAEQYADTVFAGFARARIAELSAPRLARPPVAAMPEGDIVIGIVTGLTGPLADQGEIIRKVTELAVADINAAGGVLGRKLDAKILDDACDPQQAADAASWLAGAGAVFVSGHLCDDASMRASQVYAAEHVLQVAPIAYETVFTDKRSGQGIYRLGTRRDETGRVTGGYLARTFARADIAIVYDPEYTFIEEEARETRKAMNAAGKTEVLFAPFAPDDDVDALLGKLKSAGIDNLFDAVYVAAFTKQTARLVRAMRAAGMRATVVASYLVSDDDFWDAAGPAGEGVVLAHAPDPLAHPAAAGLKRALEARGIEPYVFAPAAYATIQVFAQAAEKAGTTDFDALVAAMDSDVFDTVIGRISFDGKGDFRPSDVALFRWHDGALQPL